MMPIKMLYVTCKNSEEARAIAHELVSSRLAACGNIFSGVQSIYMWENKVQCEEEAVLILKTTSSQILECETKIKHLHSYQTPCILEIDLNGGNPDYLKWVTDQTLPP